MFVMFGCSSVIIETFHPMSFSLLLVKCCSSHPHRHSTDHQPHQTAIIMIASHVTMIWIHFTAYEA